MKLLIITQKVDIEDDNLGFFHRWLEKFAEKVEKLYVICLWEGKHSLPENVKVYSLGKEKGYSKLRQFFRFQKFQSCNIFLFSLVTFFLFIACLLVKEHFLVLY